MFGFPIPLYNSGSSSVKMTTDADSGFIKPVVREIFYSIKDGNWSDISVWQTASGRVGLLPTANDDVYIRHRIYIDVSSLSAYNVFISGTFYYGPTGNLSKSLSVFGNLQCTGTIDSTTGTGFGLGISLYGTDNYINNYILSNDTTGGIQYARFGDQPIMPLTYRRLLLSGSGIKYLTGDTNVIYETNIQNSTLELSQYNFSSGSQPLQMNGNLTKNSSGGSTIFNGNLNLTNNNNNNFVSFFGNANVECRGGITHGNGFNGFSRFSSGTGTWSFTTNNQSILDNNANGQLVFQGDVYIDSNITLTIGVGGGTRISVYLTGNTIGGNASSKIINRDNLYFNTALSVTGFMNTGIVDFSTYNTNTVYYNGNYSATLPSNTSTYNNLTIVGTGTKTLGVNTTVNGNLLLQGVLNTNTSGILQCSTYNLTINGTTTSNSGSLLKSGTGNVLFVGTLIAGNGYNYNTLNFSGNPNVELRGGITGNQYAWSPVLTGGSFNTGTGTWTFTTNNQTISLPIASYPHTFNCAITISGAITITFTSFCTITNILNGDNANSKLLIGTSSTITYNNATQPMATGILDTSTNLNTWIYGSGNQDIKGGPTTLAKQVYRNLTLSGSGTTKTLQGYVSVQNTYTLGTGVTLNNNGYTLTNP